VFSRTRFQLCTGWDGGSAPDGGAPRRDGRDAHRDEAQARQQRGRAGVGVLSAGVFSAAVWSVALLARSMPRPCPARDAALGTQRPSWLSYRSAVCFVRISPTAVALSQWAQVPSRAFGFLGTSVCPCRPYCRVHCGARLLAGWARHRRDTRAEALCLRAKPPRNIRVTHKLVVRHARTANLSSTGLDVFSDHAATAKAIHAAENTQQSCRTAPRFWGLPQ